MSFSESHYCFLHFSGRNWSTAQFGMHYQGLLGRKLRQQSQHCMALKRRLAIWQSLHENSPSFCRLTIFVGRMARQNVGPYSEPWVAGYNLAPTLFARGNSSCVIGYATTKSHKCTVFSCRCWRTNAFKIKQRKCIDHSLRWMSVLVMFRVSRASSVEQSNMMIDVTLLYVTWSQTFVLLP